MGTNRKKNATGGPDVQGYPDAQPCSAAIAHAQPRQALPPTTTVTNDPRILPTSRAGVSGRAV